MVLKLKQPVKPSLKAKYCPRVAAVSCTEKHAKPIWPWPLRMTLKFHTVLEIVEVHVHAKFHQVKCSGLWVVMQQQRERKKNKKKRRDDAENNTVVATADNNKRLPGQVFIAV